MWVRCANRVIQSFRRASRLDSIMRDPQAGGTNTLTRSYRHIGAQLPLSTRRIIGQGVLLPRRISMLSAFRVRIGDGEMIELCTGWIFAGEGLGSGELRRRRSRPRFHSKLRASTNGKGPRQGRRRPRHARAQLNIWLEPSWSHCAGTPPRRQARHPSRIAIGTMSNDCVMRSMSSLSASNTRTPRTATVRPAPQTAP